MKIFAKIIGIISKLLFNLAEISMFGMVAVIFVNVVMRYVFNNPFYWGEEVTNLLLVSFTFFSVADILLNKKHIKLTIFVEKYSSKTNSILDFFICIIGILFTALISREIYIAAAMAYNTKMSSPTLLSVPYVIPYSIMTIGFVTLFLAYIIRLGQTISVLIGKA